VPLMAGKKHSASEIAGKLHRVEELLNDGKTLSEATRSIGVSRQTLYRWRGEQPTLSTKPKERLRELETENVRLRKLVTDLLLQKMAIEEALKRKG